jgi:8-oxo-dGTP diphosphatase
MLFVTSLIRRVTEEGYSESIETSAIRGAEKEVSLKVELIEQFYVYSDPKRDARQHTLAIAFIATAEGKPAAADDAKSLGVFHQWELPQNLCFDLQ